MRHIFKFLRINSRIYIRRIIHLISSKVELRTFIILASLVVGILSGLASAILKNFVHFLEVEPKIYFDKWGIAFLLPFTPLLGIVLSVLVVNAFFSGKISKGISNVIYIILRKSSDIPKVDMISHFITSGITVGLGGSAGLEAPIVVTGAAFGSNIAKELKFNYKTRTLLLACGSAAGISAIFNSPVGGVIFAIEVLLPEFSIPSFIPLLIASASAAVVSKFLYSGQLFFLVTQGWVLNAIPFYIILGILSGIISLYNIKATFLIEDYFEKIKKQYIRAVIGGVVLCLLIFMFPSLYGEGYITIMNLLAGNFGKIIPYAFLTNIFDKDLLLIIIALLIVVTKVIATSFTISSGGNGGIIAPSLFIGAFTGFFLAKLLNYLGIADLNYANFIVVGMAGVLAGTLHAPLTGIFLIAEVTGGYILVVPLMIVTALSFFISRHFHPNSVYSTPLFQKGIKFRSEKEKYFIQQIKVSELLESDFVILQPNTTLRKIVNEVIHAKRNLFPVVDKDNMVVGIITLNNIREIMLNTDVYDVILAFEVMDSNFHSIDINADMNIVLEMFEEHDVWNLVVTDKGKYCGFISKSNIFNRYLSSWAKHQGEAI